MSRGYAYPFLSIPRKTERCSSCDSDFDVSEVSPGYRYEGSGLEALEKCRAAGVSAMCPTCISKYGIRLEAS